MIIYQEISIDENILFVLIKCVSKYILIYNVGSYVP